MNQADNVVSDMLTGIAAVNPNVAYDSEGEVIYRKNKTEKAGDHPCFYNVFILRHLYHSSELFINLQ